MNATRRIVTFGVCALVVLVVATSMGEARPMSRDQVYRDPLLDHARPATVAVLPVATVAEQPTVERAVEAGWVTLYADAQTHWMPTQEVRAKLEEGSAEPGSLAAAVDRQLWRDATISPVLAGHLCRLLGVDAVLTVRVDRWELADGGRGIVEMTAVLTGEDGRRLWSISGMAGCGTPPSSVERNFTLGSESVFFNPALEPREDGRRMVRALRTLMARWAWQLPVPIAPGKSLSPSLLAQVGLGS